ncbi:MAG TPA: helix-turn-helix domain-containing protein [Phycisphaerae bacterium]|nr:helix-turn-helix domain-containing protein [Phycisphaerae bacterium]
MGKKMYYTEEQAAQKLGIPVEGLADHIRDNKLRVFQDGPRKMFKVDEVDALAGGGEEEIELAPADSTADQVDLSAEQPKPPGKEDTVITAAGISIFDDEELEIEAADPMAKTQIAPSLEEQIATEGVGSGSGLLDLTRESDDTSLGAEVLDHIDVEGGVGSDLGVESGPTPDVVSVGPAAIVVEAAYVEAMDASSGLFNGALVGCAVVAIVMGMVVIAAVQGLTPSYLTFMKEHVGVVLAAILGVIVLTGIFGLMVGKSVAARQAAMRKIGG